MGHGRELGKAEQPGRHVFDGGVAAGKQKYGDIHNDTQQAELRHGGRLGGEQHAESGHGKQIHGLAEHEQCQRAVNRHSHGMVHHQQQREQGGNQDNQAVGQNFGHHDFVCVHRHHQQVLNRAVFAFADHGRAHQQDGEQGGVAHQLVERHKLFAAQVFVEQHVYHRLEGRGVTVLPQIGRRFAVHDLADVHRAHAGLRHGGGVHQ